MADPSGSPRLTPITEHEFPVVRELAETIWRQHYTGIITREQIDYMLAGRFSDDALRDQIQAPDKWLELLRLSGVPVGYCLWRLRWEKTPRPLPEAGAVAALVFAGQKLSFPIRRLPV